MFMTSEEKDEIKQKRAIEKNKRRLESLTNDLNEIFHNVQNAQIIDDYVRNYGVIVPFGGGYHDSNRVLRQTLRKLIREEIKNAIKP